jgi:hypothetical protein
MSPAFRSKVFAETASVKGNQKWHIWIVTDGQQNRVAECCDALGWHRGHGQTLIAGRGVAEELAAEFNKSIGAA